MRDVLKMALIALVVANVLAFTVWIFLDDLVKGEPLPAQVRGAAGALPEVGFDPAAQEEPPAAERLLEPPVEAGEADAAEAEEMDSPSAAQTPVAGAEEAAVETAVAVGAEDVTESGPGQAPSPAQAAAPAEDAAPAEETPPPAQPEEVSPAPVTPVRVAESVDPIERDDGREAGETMACVLVGPFSRREDALEAERTVSEAGGDAQVVAESVPDAPHHLVYVAPPPTAAEAMRINAALAAQEVNAFVIPSGPRKHGVSVGLFKSEERALAQRDKVAALGYDVQIFTMSRNTIAYRLRAQGVPPAALGETPFTPCPSADQTPVAAGLDAD